MTNIWNKDFIWHNAETKKKIEVYWDDIPVVGIGLFIYGAAGTGKTTIAVSLARWWKYRSPISRVVGYDFFDILSAIKTLPEYRDLKQNATLWNLQNSKYDLLVIDDFGAGRITDAAADTVETMIRTWEKKGTIVIFTTNVHPDKIVETFNEQLWSRICGMTAYIEIEGKDWRTARKG